MSQNFSPALSPKSRAGRKWMGGGAPIAKVGPSAKVRRFQANLRIRIAVGQDILHCPSLTLRRHWHNATTFYSYGAIVTTPNNLEVGILPRLASQGNIQFPKYTDTTEETQTATQIQLKHI